MQEKRGIVAEFDTKTGFIKWFSELNKNSGNVAGGKGANLLGKILKGMIDPYIIMWECRSGQTG